MRSRVLLSARTAACIAVLLAGAGPSARGENPPDDSTTPPPAATAHPLDPALSTAEEVLAYLRENVRDYTAVIVKRETFNGQLSEHYFMSAKIRNRKGSGDQVEVPLSVYLKFLMPRSARGREVIWVEGQNDGKLIAHEGGFKNLLRFKLDPNGFIAMMGQNYPITKIGLENLVTELIERGRRERQWPECEVQFYEDAKVEDRVCTLIEITHPVQRPHFDFYRARIFIDNELNVPIRYAAWGWPATPGGEPVLIEEFTYTELKLNVGLTDKDFDPDNPDYAFP